MTNRALITGAAGQDGVYLARHLRSLGYDVVGTVVSAALSAEITDVYLPDVQLVELDIRDAYLFARIGDHHRGRTGVPPLERRAHHLRVEVGEVVAGIGHRRRTDLHSQHRPVRAQGASEETEAGAQVAQGRPGRVSP